MTVLFDKLYLIWEVQPFRTGHQGRVTALRSAVGLSFLDVGQGEPQSFKNYASDTVKTYRGVKAELQLFIIPHYMAYVGQLQALADLTPVSIVCT